MKPKMLRDRGTRETARYIRDRQWSLMERMVNAPLRVCLWDKKRLTAEPGEVRFCLISGMEFMNWVRSHRRWFVVGRKHDERDAFVMKLTKAGRWAFRHKKRYDMAPVEGGLVEPGWVAIPAPRKDSA